MSIEIKEKPCKGNDKAKGFEGCGTMQKYRKYGLGTLCGCFYKWFNEVPKKPIKKFSDKRNEQNKEYINIKNEYLHTLDYCEVIECKEKPVQVHHKKGRVGKLLTDIRFFLGVCAECHEKIELNPIWAKENNYSLNRLDK